ncbi:MAG: hypothetical protein HN348_01600 [Proteobacteria bacterium]|jgi:Zn-dependent protease|nr:hypothetical protein [Pseudomonadota bacterium]
MKIAQLAGVPIRLHWSFTSLAAAYGLYALFTSGVGGLIDAVLLAVVLFGSVVLHELGHALAARACGIQTRDITLYPFGGVAAIVRMPERPIHELIIAVAGPLVNFVLFSAFLYAYLVTGIGFLAIIALVNVIMGIFNLIPAFPMDGGRVLRAVLASRLGWYRGSRIAITVGTVFAWGFVIVGIVAWWPSLLLVGGFLHFALAAEKRRLKFMTLHDIRTGRQRAASAKQPTYAYVPRWRVR